MQSMNISNSLRECGVRLPAHRSVTITSAGQSIGDPATLRNLTLNGGSFVHAYVGLADQTLIRDNW